MCINLLCSFCIFQEGFVSPSSHTKVGHGQVVSPQQAITSHQSILSQMQAKEADIRALAELTRALDKKVEYLSACLCI